MQRINTKSTDLTLDSATTSNLAGLTLVSQERLSQECLGRGLAVPSEISPLWYSTSTTIINHVLVTTDGLRTFRTNFFGGDLVNPKLLSNRLYNLYQQLRGPDPKQKQQNLANTALLFYAQLIAHDVSNTAVNSYST